MGYLYIISMLDSSQNLVICFLGLQYEYKNKQIQVQLIAYVVRVICSTLYNP